MSRHRIQALLLGVLVLGAPAVGATSVYRWVDAAGHVHYGDRAPTGRPTESLRLDPAPAPDPDVRAREERTQRLLDAFVTERRRKAAAEQAQAEKRAKHTAQCSELKRRLGAYQRASLLYRTGPDGKRQYLTDTERDAAIAHTRALFDKTCG